EVSQMKISACIVTYNSKDKVTECIRSLYTFTRGVETDLFVVDNGSTDGTPEIVKKEFPQVRVFKSRKNLGFGRGHDAVMPLLDSDLHLVINPDIVFDRDVITELAEYMEEHCDVGMITPQIRNTDGSEQYLPKKQPNFRYVFLSKLGPFRYFRDRYTMKDREFTSPASIDNCTGCFFMIRTELFRGLRGFDKRFFLYFEDADLAGRVSEKSRIVFYPGTYVFHGWQRDNTRSFSGIRHFLASYIKFTFKWLGRR
ncbi:MAG: glycosyltransferase family 2 protein, partial [Lachnospiraceae bacterium]|nr:glycosyltransferase family 2 protein [Lachnospiraceae bacterium]